MERRFKQNNIIPAEILFVQTNFRKKDNCLFNLLEKSPIKVLPSSELNKKTDLDLQVHSDYLKCLRLKNENFKQYLNNLRSKTPNIKEIKIRNFEYLNHTTVKGKYQLPLPKLPKFERKRIIKSGSEKLFPGKYDIMDIKLCNFIEKDKFCSLHKKINNCYNNIKDIK